MPDEVDFNPKTVIFGPIFERLHLSFWTKNALLAHCEKKTSICEIRLIDYFDERETSRDDSHEDFFLRRLFPLSGGNAASWHIFVLIWHEFFKKHSSQPPLPYCHNIWLEKNNEDTCVRYSWLLRLLGRVKTKATHSLPAKTSRYTLHLLILRSLKTSSTFC